MLGITLHSQHLHIAFFTRPKAKFLPKDLCCSFRILVHSKYLLLVCIFCKWFTSKWIVCLCNSITSRFALVWNKSRMRDLLSFLRPFAILSKKKIISFTHHWLLQIGIIQLLLTLVKNVSDGCHLFIRSCNFDPIHQNTSHVTKSDSLAISCRTSCKDSCLTCVV